MHFSLFHRNLGPISTRLTSLGKKSKWTQFWKRKKHEKEIQDFRASIASHLQDFTFHNNISIKTLVDQMSIKVDQADTSLQRIELQDQQGPSRGDGGQGQAGKSPSGDTKSQRVNNHGAEQGPREGEGDDQIREALTVINYISGGTGGHGGEGGVQGGGGGSGKGPTLYYTINTVENFTTVNSDQVQQTLAKIKYVSARYNAPNTPDKCMEGTRIDIIQDIVAHLTAPSGPSQRIVMLSGSAGTGKSTIAKTVASILAEEQHILAASFFFSRNYAERREIIEYSCEIPE
ncbi:hypothetical protein C8R45DRAFT_549678 [Mycena sanguinolenta]|nr:hypothetical protein C8R45DRAFT_549678 [Mycena sanguinolenta]